MHEGHRKRMKERFKTEGLSSFSDVQALELLLFYALPRADTNPAAHRLLDRFGSLARLFEADISDIAKVEGIGEGSALLIKLLPEMTRKFWIENADTRRPLSTVEQAADFIRPILFGRPVELVYVFCLDNQFRLKHYDCVSRGGVDDATVYPRQVAECAIRLHASKVIIAHNHPGGDPRPSSADGKTTRSLAAALSPLGIELLDHIIFSGHGYFSFSAKTLPGQKYADRPFAPPSGK